MSYETIIESLTAENIGPAAVQELSDVRLVTALIDGKTGTQALQDAGYGALASRTPWKLISGEEMRARFQQIAERKGLNLDKISAKINEHLEARANQTLEGKEVVQSEAPDYKVQQKALDQLTTLLGMQDAAKAAGSASSITLSISGPAADRLARALGGE